MRKPWLLIGPALLAGVLAFGVAACDDEEDDNGNGEPVATEPDGGEATEPMEDGEATEPMEDGEATEPAE